MSAEIIDGSRVAANVRSQIRALVDRDLAQGKRAPGLAVVLVGDNPASQSYVRSKERVAARCGFYTEQYNLEATTSAQELDDVLNSLNNNPLIDGILLQLPLPPHLDAVRHLTTISPEKDADGLHIVNQGRLVRGEGGVRPCTPLGVMRLLDEVLIKGRSNEQDILPRARLSGKKACVVGRSILVGKPVAMMLLEADATVTIAHSRTHDLPAVVRDADIVVAACGRPRMIGGDWIKPGAIVIDVGINRLDDGSLVGDVDFWEASLRASAITPVPGGVGPMTVAMLMYNTWYLRGDR
jgi:methylenetetrahydrofolate dehydrogenase (NADP+)/methenyltetrahydrofolate cyclohydrolase